MRKKKAYVDEDHNDGVRKYKDANSNQNFPESINGENTIILRQNAELDHSDGEWIHKLVNVPVLKGRDENLLERQICKVSSGIC